jgi:hypothetical protein
MTTLHKPIDVLDAAVEDVFTNLGRTEECFRCERQTPTPASIFYSFWGDYRMGGIKLIKRDEVTTEFIVIERTEDKFDSMTPEQRAEELVISNQSDSPHPMYRNEEERQKLIAIWEKAYETHRQAVNRYTKAQEVLEQEMRKRGLWVEFEGADKPTASPATAQAQVTDATPTKPSQNELPDDFVPPTAEIGKKYYGGYNRTTAKQIGDAFLKAWAEYNSEDNFDAKFTVTLIAKHTPTRVETASRYIGVFRKAGITHIHKIPLPKEQARERAVQQKRKRTIK